MQPRAVRLAPLILALLLAGAPAQAVGIHTMFTHSELAWRTIATEHFYIHYDQSLEESARYAAAVAELAYARVAGDIGFNLAEQYDIILRDSDDYANGSTDPADGAITIWLTPMDFNLRGNHRWLQNVIYHELTHMLHMRTAGVDLLESRRLVGPLLTMPNLMSPVWFTEGLAQYKAERGTEEFDSFRTMILRTAVLDDQLLPYAKMSVFGKNSFEYERAYSQGYALVRYVAATYGDSALARIVREKGEGFEEFDEALRLVIGLDGEQLYDSWVASLRERSADWSQREPLVVSRLEVDAGWSDQNPAVSADGRWLAYASNGRHDFQRLQVWRRDLASPQAPDRAIADEVNPGLGISADGARIYYTVTEEDRRGNNFSDLFVWEDGAARRVTQGARVFYPAPFPDDRRVAAVQQGQGHAALVLVDLADGAVTVLYRGEFEEQLFAPRVSPDGNRIMYARFHRGHRDLCVYDLRDGGNLPLPFTTGWNEESGCWLPDGGIVFAADYEGVYDLFRWDGGRQVTRVTRTTAGYFEPAAANMYFPTAGHSSAPTAVMPPAAAAPPVKVAAAAGVPAAEVRLYATLYTGRGFDIVALDLPRGEQPAYDAPPAPAYKAGDDLAPDTGLAFAYENRWRSPYRVPWLAYDGTQFVAGLAASANDVLARHIVNLQANYNFKGHSPLGGFQYINRVWYPTLVLQGFSTRRAYEELVPEKNAGGAARDDYHENWRLLNLDAIFPVTNRLALTVGGRWEKVGSNETLEYMDARRQRPFEGNLCGYEFGASYSDLIPTSDYDIGIAAGYKVDVAYGHQVKLLHGDFDFETWRMDAEYYLPTRWQHQALAFKLHGGLSNGQGPMQGIFQLGGNSGLRGYGSNCYRGSKLALGSVEYTFPLWYDIAHLASFFYFDGLYMRLFGDFGRAWDGPWWWREVHAGYGGSLILKATMYYSIPYHIELGAARGIDDRDSVRFYLGLGSLF